MRIESFAAGRLRFDSCACVERFVRMLIRVTMRGRVRWQANQRCTRYAGTAVVDNHRFSVAIAYRKLRGHMLRVACATHRESSCIGGIGFFMGDARYNRSPLEKLWRAIRKSRREKGEG